MCRAPIEALLSFAVLSVMCKQVTSIKCYQCSSFHNHGCFSFNLNDTHLKECKGSSNKQPPVCRSLSQINYFIEGQDVNVIRECAYQYQSPLDCYKSKFSDLHYSYACECNEDGCNLAVNGRHLSKYIVSLLMLVTLYKFCTFMQM